jgi:hypothetical protein
MTMPAAIEWSTRLYPENRRPIALVNTSFHLGSIVALQTTGAVLTVLGWTGALTLLGTLVAALFGGVVCYVVVSGARGPVDRWAGPGNQGRRAPTGTMMPK